MTTTVKKSVSIYQCTELKTTSGGVWSLNVGIDTKTRMSNDGEIKLNIEYWGWTVWSDEGKNFL